ncbi:PspC domain-containing protein [Sphingomonas sp. TZW2008]|uniref:PspC domain-containing protein n=1 Tax=Sphingomonas sp. TZW2008 TaxID=1917973 RepID=UPI0011817B30|nr:PspC domain-containing protein [Sphingomonas sp. TZW2008]
MTSQTTKLAAPKDNLLGICNALGEDFGFNPLWLRLALGCAFVIQPINVVIGYLALGLIVLVSRLAFPEARTSTLPERARGEALPASTDPVDEDFVFAKAA